MLSSKFSRLVAAGAMAAGVVTGSIVAAPGATAATKPANVTPDAGACKTVTQNGWNIGLCADVELFEAWGDAYVNAHGGSGPGCSISLYVWLDSDPAGTEQYEAYPCSTSGHIGPLTFTGFDFGHVTTKVVVEDEYGQVFFNQQYTY